MSYPKFNPVLAAFRQHIKRTCPVEGQQSRLMHNEELFVEWEEHFAKDYAARELGDARSEATEWVFTVVHCAIVQTDFMINASHQSRRSAKHWANAIKSCRGFAIPGPFYPADHSTDRDGSVFSTTDQCWVKWSTQ